jgi:hypothetical protein
MKMKMKTKMKMKMRMRTSDSGSLVDADRRSDLGRQKVLVVAP